VAGAAPGRAGNLSGTIPSVGYSQAHGLGAAHGIVPGVQVIIHKDTDGQVATGIVEATSQTDAAAQVTISQEIKVGYLVCRA
jgi:hypothetical protein